MKTRKPTFEELFPVAHQQALLKKQSTHFTNQTISKMSISGGYENMPTNFVEVQGEPPVVIHPNSPTKLVGNYFNNNWKPLLTMLVVGGILAYVLIHSNNNKKSKRETDKNQYKL
jgi:hypothetical protein